VLARSLPGFGVAVHPSPTTHDALDVGGGPGASDAEETLLRLPCGDAGDRPDLGVRQLAARQSVGQMRQRAEGARDPNALARGPQIESNAPAQPRGARAET